MNAFLASCPMCAWESTAADLPEVAVDLGVQHLEQVHGPAIVAGTHPAVRVWQFRQLTDAEVTRQARAEKQPEPAPHPPAAHPPARQQETPPRGEKPRRKD